MSTNDEPFTSAEVMGGFSAKRARLLLFQIENRTAYVTVQSQRAVSGYLTEEAAEQQDLAYFEALAEGREAVRPTLRDLERSARQWQSLVPQKATLQAALADLLGQKYRFTRRDIPHIRQALALDSEEVQRAFERQFQRPLPTIYTWRAGPLEWIGWSWNRLSGWLEDLPPFWTAYALTFTETVGASILALPIALAGVGPLPGVVILLVMGVINMLTVASMAEAVTRNGSIRYQGNYLGRLVRDYLGGPSSMLLTIMVVTISVLLLFAYYIGFSLTLASATPVPAEVWVGILFLLGVYFVRRNNLHATISSALLVGTINLGLIVILSALALGHLRFENLLYVHVPFLNGRPFEPALLGLIFGVAFTAYFGHFSASSCARTVLQRDPGGRSLIWGCIAAQVSAMALYILWVVAVNGAVPPPALVNFSGTALTPLARVVGPAVNVFGTILAVLAMGMASIHFSLALFFTVREWIPGRTRHTLVLGRRQGRLFFVPRSKANSSLALTYLGLKANATQSGKLRPQFRLDLLLDDNLRRFEIEVRDTWEATNLFAELMPKLPPNAIQLTMKIVSASSDLVRVQLTTSMWLRYEGNMDTLGLALFETADTGDAAIAGWLAGREPASVQEVARYLEQPEQETQILLNRMVEQGVLVESGEQGGILYQVHFAPRRRRQATPAIWQALSTSETPGPRRTGLPPHGQKRMPLQRVKEVVQGEAARSWLAITPLLLIFLVVEWLLLNHLESFSQVVSFVGVVAVAVMAGVFPVLLLLASRRKGDNIPGSMLRFLGHPLVVGGIYLVAVGILFLHGLFIWQNLFQRLVAILVGVVVLVMTYLLVRRAAFTRRVVIELRQDPAETESTTGIFAVTDTGQRAMQTSVRLGYPDEEQAYESASGVIPNFPGVRSAKFRLAATRAGELKVWPHRVSRDDQSETIPALVKVSSHGEAREFQIDDAGEQFVVPLRGRTQHESEDRSGEPIPIEVEIQLSTSRSDEIHPAATIAPA